MKLSHSSELPCLSVCSKKWLGIRDIYACVVDWRKRPRWRRNSFLPQFLDITWMPSPCMSVSLSVWQLFRFCLLPLPPSFTQPLLFFAESESYCFNVGMPTSSKLTSCSSSASSTRCYWSTCCFLAIIILILSAANSSVNWITHF